MHSHSLNSLAHAALARGDTATALSLFMNAAKDEKLSPLERENAVLGEIETLRLSGRRDEAERLLNRLPLVCLSEAHALALRWEAFCISLSEKQKDTTKNLEKNLMKFLPDADSTMWHEALLWSHALSEPIRALKNGDKTLLGRIAETLEAIETSDLTFAKRCEELEKVLFNAREKLPLHQELLLWLAAARWYERNNCARPSMSCLLEYRALSLRLSAGATGDVLHLAPEVAQDNGIGRLVASV